MKDWDFFVNENEVSDIIDKILTKSREGDILIIGGQSYYISGFGENRKLIVLGSKIVREDEVVKLVLPYEANIVIEEYNIKTKEDINRYYPGLNISGIINEEGRIIYFK